MLNEKGFTLLETVVTLGILGLVAVALLSGLATSSKANIIAEERAVAESLARSELEYIRKCTYQYSTTEYPVNPLLNIPEGWNIVPPVVEPLHATDDGIQKVTVSIEHNNRAVLSVNTFKVDR